ncbi:MAG TPA: glycosyltransferase family 39 protein [Candidatus Acidoferrum sp.]|nr:glycosyltransferase family 39 protein [Candidatus Acidoferrum sp.]
MFLTMRVNMLLAALAGLALRVLFILKFPATDSGDAPFYIELAWNWLKNRVYGFPIHGVLTPVDMRVPGYPAFVAAIFEFAGESPMAVMFAQAVLDVVTCFVIALIAARLAPLPHRRRVTLAALWLAALCPFTANYTAVLLTETLTIFLTALAILVLLGTEIGVGEDTRRRNSLLNPWFLGGIVAGLGTLVRPETPLVLLSAGLIALAKWWRPRDWRRLLRAGVLMGIGLVLPLVPWAARNWKTLHEVRFLAPRYSQLPGEFTPHGFIDWTNTWLWRFRDVYLTLWKLNDEKISIDDIPASAFDSSEAHARVSSLLDEYNKTQTIEPDLDAEFGKLARERTARHPLRTYLEIPFLRCLTLWFAPRLELLPISGQLTPVRSEWEDDRKDFLETLGLITLNSIYVGLALVGLWVVRRRPCCLLPLVFIVVRTVFFVYAVETPEPRYVLECFPALIVLGAQSFTVRFSFLRRAPDEWSPGKSAETAL